MLLYCCCKYVTPICTPCIGGILKKLREAIKEKDEDSFHRHIIGFELLQDEERTKELLDGSLTYAAYIGFQPAVETFIQKGAGKECN